ncbi:hypothetical protein AB4114_03080 [Paenibacillus sp. 2RAB27]|uniref:hypothetical protein n=1 Tax=Paenibacillus sp. 2RAB27 TaxID=3232991 RepID=UPI003F94ACC0
MRVVGKALQEKKEMGRLTLQRPEADRSQDGHLLKKRHEALIELSGRSGHARMRIRRHTSMMFW